MLNKINLRGLKRSFCLFLCAILTTTGLQAQFEIGAWIGGNNYQGDLNEAQIVLRETQLAYGGLMRYNINPFFSARVHYLRGRLTGTDLNSSNVEVRRRGYSFTTNLNELGIIGEYNSLGNSSKSYDFKFLFNPYLFTGVGITSTTGTPQAPEDVIPSPFPEKGSKNTFFTLPIGGGIRIQPLEQLSIGIEWGSRFTFSDYLDGVSQNANPKKKDWYMFGGLTLTYVFDYDSY